MPFFKTLTIYFVLFADEPRLESPLYCVIKCLPVISLMFFVLLHGMSFSEYYSYSRKVSIYVSEVCVTVCQYAVYAVKLTVCTPIELEFRLVKAIESMYLCKCQI